MTTYTHGGISPCIRAAVGTQGYDAHGERRPIPRALAQGARTSL